MYLCYIYRYNCLIFLIQNNSAFIYIEIKKKQQWYWFSSVQLSYRSLELRYIYARGLHQPQIVSIALFRFFFKFFFTFYVRVFLLRITWAFLVAFKIKKQNQSKATQFVISLIFSLPFCFVFLMNQFRSFVVWFLIVCVCPRLTVYCVAGFHLIYTIYL